MNGLAGGCACRAVRFTTEGGHKFAYRCHCRACQQMTGTGQSVAAAFDKAQVQVTGSPAVFTRDSDSGHKVMPHFCGTCGSPVFNTMTRAETMMMVDLGAFDDPGAVTPDRRFHEDEAPAWDRTAGGTGA